MIKGITVLLTVICTLVFSPILNAQNITTVAGTGMITPDGGNGDGGPATAAELANVISIAFDISGNMYFLQEDCTIRAINTSGIISTIAGNGALGYSGDGGPATDATLFYPAALAVDHTGNIYFSDNGNNAIRKINTSGIISTIAGLTAPGYNGDNQPATDAMLNSPNGVAVDDAGNIYIADGSNFRVRKINTSGIITTIAGGGSISSLTDFGSVPATNIELGTTQGLAVDNEGNVYVSATDNADVEKIDTRGYLTRLAGNYRLSAGYSGDGGPATAAQFAGPTCLSIDDSGNVLVADMQNHRIRKVNAAGIITTIAGNGTPGYSGDGGLATNAQLNYPEGLAVDNSGNIFIGDKENHVIRKVDISGTNENNSVKNTNVTKDFPHIYPDPGNGTFTMIFPSAYDEAIQAIITTVTGQKVKEMAMITNRKTPVKLDLPAGCYIVSATVGGIKYTQSFTIKQ